MTLMTCNVKTDTVLARPRHNSSTSDARREHPYPLLLTYLDLVSYPRVTVRLTCVIGPAGLYRYERALCIVQETIGRG
jgi:hypothetical protein